MSINKKRSITLLLAFAMLLSILAPNFSRAYTQETGNQNDASLTINKFKQEPGTAVGDAGTGGDLSPGPTSPTNIRVAGVKFKITQTHTFNPATSEWADVTGIAPVLTGVTDINGKVEFVISGGSATETSAAKVNGLTLGRWKVEEIEITQNDFDNALIIGPVSPKDVILNTTPYYVDVPMTSADGNNLNYNVYIYPKNKIVRQDVTFTKVGNDKTAFLGEVNFKLFNDDSATLGGEGTPYLVAGNQVEVSSSTTDGKVTVANLPKGKYYFQETSTVTGYALNNTHIEFEVRKQAANAQLTEVVFTEVTDFVVNGTTTGDVKVINYEKPTISKTINGPTLTELSTNRVTPFTFNLKVNTPPNVKEYSSLVITDTLDSRFELLKNVDNNNDGWNVTGTTKENITFNQVGQVLTWTVTNKTLLTPGTPIVITIDAQLKADAVLAVNETSVNNTFNLAWNNGRGASDTITSNVVNVIPTQGSLDITKVIKRTNTILPGAVFKLTDTNGTTIVAPANVITVNGTLFTGALEGLTTGANGKITITGLPTGSYKLVETQAPAGYRLLTKAIDITINSGETATYTVANSATGWNLPTTGGIGTVLFTVIGISFMGAAIFLLTKNKKHTEV